MHCLATPFCVDENPIPAGENDLRVIGEVLRHFHENPLFDLPVEAETFRVQVIFLTLGLDELNQIGPPRAIPSIDPRHSSRSAWHR